MTTFDRWLIAIFAIYMGTAALGRYTQGACQ